MRHKKGSVHVHFLLVQLLAKFEIDRVEQIFRYLQIGTACYVAFAHGSNDVANATGPIAAALGYLGQQMPPWVLLVGGLGISIGIATWGYRVNYLNGLFI